LTLHRIQRNDVALRPKGQTPVVFLYHGLASSSYTWIGQKPNVSLAYKLASAGYDVWLGNNRGNKYSLKSIDEMLNSNPKKYFNYSFPELGLYDLPANI